MTLAPQEVVQAPARAWRRYVKRKDSGVEWLGEIPDHWNLERLKVAVSAPVKKGYGMRRSFIALEHIRSGSGSLVDGYEPEIVAADDYALFEEGDILFGKLRPYLRKYWLATFSGCCPTELLVLRPQAQIFEPKFFNFSVGSSYFVAVANATSYGVKMPRTSWEIMGSQPIPIPSLPEQRAITAFLDRETQKIDDLIAKRERLIDLLEEKRTALINRAVTKGLDSDVSMKDSGVEWLGEIPAHWNMTTLRRLLTGIEQGSSPVAEDRVPAPEDWGVVKISAIDRGFFRPEEAKALPENVPLDSRYEIRAGDLLLTRGNTPGLVGEVCLVSDVRPGLMLSDLVYRLSVAHKKGDQRYLMYWLLSRAGRYQITRDARGSSQSMVKVSQEHIRSWFVALPPLSEQRAIVNFIDQQTNKIDTLLGKVREHIEKLREYRTALISAAVTGKIDVREEVS